MPVVAQLRALFDLDAHPAAVAEHLARDRGLGRLVALRRPARPRTASSASWLPELPGFTIAGGVGASWLRNHVPQIGAGLRLPFHALRRMYTCVARSPGTTFTHS